MRSPGYTQSDQTFLKGYRQFWSLSYPYVILPCGLERREKKEMSIFAHSLSLVPIVAIISFILYNKLIFIIYELRMRDK